MPLSEHEEQILAEIERQLAAEDPRFAARARRTPLRSASRTTRLRLAAAIGLLGFTSLVLLVLHVAFGAVGLSLIFVALLLGVKAAMEPTATSSVPVPPDERG